MTEVELGNVALKNAGSAEVKDFAQLMILTTLTQSFGG